MCSSNGKSSRNSCQKKDEEEKDETKTAATTSQQQYNTIADLHQGSPVFRVESPCALEVITWASFCLCSRQSSLVVLKLALHRLVEPVQVVLPC